MRDKKTMRRTLAADFEKEDKKVEKRKPATAAAHKRIEEQRTLSGAQALLSISKGLKLTKITKFTNDHGLEEISSENYHQRLLMAFIKRIIAFSQSASAQHAYTGPINTNNNSSRI